MPNIDVCATEWNGEQDVPQPYSISVWEYFPTYGKETIFYDAKSLWKFCQRISWEEAARDQTKKADFQSLDLSDLEITL